MHQAQETFVADMKDGTTIRVAKGEVLHDTHELVLRDRAGSGLLFRRLDLGEEAPAKRPRGRPRKTTVAAIPPDDADDEDE